jgi:16S rRNA (cytidine1402-2'-O)-methyltransferase
MELYIVSTPIGNLKDITLRALEVLASVDVVVCEDTRVTGKLLHHYKIAKKMMSFHARSEDSKMDSILTLLKEGKKVALLTDAGTPTISDPGSILVSEIRTQLPEVRIIPIPGASAALSALSVSGFPASEFLFVGFIPHKKGRQTLFKKIIESECTVVFYESPHRILKTLSALKALDPERRILVARELTKLFEETLLLSTSEALGYYEKNEDKIRGEFCVVVSPKSF